MPRVPRTPAMTQPWDYIAKLVCIGDSGTGKSSLTIRLCEGRFSANHDVTIGVECGSRIVPVGPPASTEAGLDVDIDGDTADSSDANTRLHPASETEHTTPASIQTTTSTTTTTTTTTTSKSRSKPTQHDPQPRQKHMKLSLWDTAGQETYKSITRSYFRGASGALLVFDITRPATFASVTQWLTDLRLIADEDIIVVLVGNKSDLVTPQHGPGGGKQMVTREQAEAWCRENGVGRYVETSAKSGEGVERAFLEVAERIYRGVERGRYDLADRRSGVRSYGGSKASGGVGGPGGLGMSEAVNGKEGWGGGCC